MKTVSISLRLTTTALTSLFTYVPVIHLKEGQVQRSVKMKRQNFVGSKLQATGLEEQCTTYTLSSQTDLVFPIL